MSGDRERKAPDDKAPATGPLVQPAELGRAPAAGTLAPHAVLGDQFAVPAWANTSPSLRDGQQELTITLTSRSDAWLAKLPSVAGGTLVDLKLGGDLKARQNWGRISGRRGSGAEPDLVYPALPKSALGTDPAIDGIVAKIKAARSAIPKREMGRSANNNAGWDHNPDPHVKSHAVDAGSQSYNAWLKQVLAGGPPAGIDAKRWEIYQQIQPLEGQPTRVTTFDNTLSIGAGFSSAGGLAQRILWLTLQGVPEARDVFLEAGMSVGTDPVTKAVTIEVVDTKYGWILSGKDAINYIDTSPELLQLIVNLIEGSLPVPGAAAGDPIEADKQRMAALTAQFQAFSEMTLKGIEEKRSDGVAVVDWPEPERLMAVHARHGAPGLFPYSFWDTHPHSSPAEVARQIYLNSPESVADTIIEATDYKGFGAARPKYRRDKAAIGKHVAHVAESAAAAKKAVNDEVAADKAAKDTDAALAKAKEKAADAASKATEAADKAKQAKTEAEKAGSGKLEVAARKAADAAKAAADRVKTAADTALGKAETKATQRHADATAKHQAAEDAKAEALRAPDDAKAFARMAAVEEADFVAERAQIADDAAAAAEAHAAAAKKAVDAARDKLAGDREAVPGAQAQAAAAAQKQRDAASVHGKSADEKAAAKQALEAAKQATTAARATAKAASDLVTSDTGKVKSAAAAQEQADAAAKKARKHADELDAAAKAKRDAVPTEEPALTNSERSPRPDGSPAGP